MGRDSSGKRNRWEILWLSRKTLPILHFLEEKNTFANKEGSDTYKIREGLHLDCNSEKVMLVTCKKCQKQYAGSCITRFWTRFNKYRSCHRKFCRGHSVIQVSFQAHFIIDEERNKQETKKSNSKSNKIV